MSPKSLKNVSQTFSGFLFRIGMNDIIKNLDKSSNSLLDIGCGNGRPVDFINKQKRFLTVGVDGFLPYLKECKSNRIYDDCILCDIRFLPIKLKTFDIILCLQVIEHLSRNDGIRLIREIEEIATRQIVITTPVDFLSQGKYDENPYQVHRSAWTPYLLRNMGYKVKISNFSFGFGIIAQIVLYLTKYVRSRLPDFSFTLMGFKKLRVCDD